MDSCKHVNRISPAADHSIVNPQKWLCFICGTTESVWACLSCSNVACGRYNEEHALTHYKDSKHPLALEVNDKYVFCYECDDYVLNDNAAGDLKILRQALGAIARQSFQGLDGTNKRLLRSQSFHGFENRNRDVNKLRSEDKGYTALKFRRVVLLTKMFQAWRACTQKAKRLKTQKPVSKDDSCLPMRRTSSRPRRRKKGVMLPGVTGLRNLGNTCYMNSILQVLSHLDIFKQFFLTNDPSSTLKAIKDSDEKKPTKYLMRQTTMECFEEMSESLNNSTQSVKGGLNGGSSHSSTRIKKNTTTAKDHKSLGHELHAVLRVMWSGKWARISPHAMLQAVWKVIPFFKGYSQQDAQEFLSEFLGKVQTELEQIYPKMAASGPPSIDIVSQTFQGQLVSQVTCLKCKNVSSTYEPFMDLSLEFPQRFQVSNTSSLPLSDCHLKEMLNKFTSVEKLDGPIYACESCNSRRRKAANKPTIRTEVQKRMLLERLPSVLRLHLKRFVWSGRNNRGKISTRVGFHKALDMAPYCNPGSDVGSTMYSLSAAVVHHGRGFGSGHYTSYCWNQQADSWLHCNDSRMELCTMHDVMNCQAYILVYTRCHQSWHINPLDLAPGSLETIFEEEIDPEVSFNFRNSAIPKFMDLKRQLKESNSCQPILKRRRTATW